MLYFCQSVIAQKMLPIILNVTNINRTVHEKNKRSSICTVFQWLGYPVFKWHSKTIHPLFDHLKSQLVWYSDPHCLFLVLFLVSSANFWATKFPELGVKIMQIFIISGWRGAWVFSQAGGQPVGGESQKRVEVSQDWRQFGRGDGRNGKNQRSPTQVELGYVEENFLQ